MQGSKIVIPFHIPGTLAADLAIVFTMPFAATLVQVQAVATNNSDATLKVGTTSDDDAYLAVGVIGDSSVPAERERGALVGAEYPHIADGTVMKITLDHDGAVGTAAQNVTILLTFVEG